MLEKKQYYAMDFMKFALAVLLVCAHASSERLKFPPYIDIWFSLYIIVVPFFFTSSAFFFFKKLENEDNKATRKQYYLHYTKRILQMYLVWSLIYTCFKFANWICTDTFSWKEFGKHVFYSITYTSYPTIWFLPALWVAVTLVYCCFESKMKLHWVLIISLLCYGIGWGIYTLPADIIPCSELIEWYKQCFISPRNGLFNGFIYAAVGAYLARNYVSVFDAKGKSSIFYYLVSVIILGGAIGEVLLTKRYVNSHVDANFVFLLIPFTYSFVIATGKTKLKPHPVYLFCRNMSLLLFLSQRIFLTAIPSLLPASVVVNVTQNPYIGLVVFLGSTFVFSFLIIELTKRFRFLKILW